jgi:hypothetical protein
MSVFLAIVAVNLALFGVVALVYELWPSLLEDEEDAAYVCKTLDNGVDTPVRACISRHDISSSSACRVRPISSTATCCSSTTRTTTRTAH